VGADYSSEEDTLEEKKITLEFLSQNVMLFAGNEFNRKVFHDKKTAFNKTRLNKLDDKLIAETIIRVYIESGRFRNREELYHFLKTNPFFENEIHADERAELLDLLDAVQAEDFPEKFTPKAVLEGIARRQAEITAEQRGVSVASERIEKLEKKIIEREAEYRSMPSILESGPIEEPPEEDATTSYSPWWRDLNLRADPFASREGLSKIPADLIDEILVRTAIFDDYLTFLRSDPEFLFYKSTIVFGQFGSGKTTFFEFVAREMINHKIYPIYVILRTQRDKFSTRQVFEEKVLNILEEEYRKATEKSAFVETSEPTIRSIKRLMIELSSGGSAVLS